MKKIKIKRRCAWTGDDVLMQKYHDTEWGVRTLDDRKLFEFLVLESAQAGLSWRTVLHKRENYRKAFANFDPQKVARFTSNKVASLLADVGIIRNKAKIEAAINNAKCFLEVQKEFGSFSKYSWKFVCGKQIRHTIRKISDFPTVISEAVAFAADLKKRGFKFLGPTIIYAHMQAVGMVDDHMIGCFRRKVYYINTKWK
ncbi:MAG: DNA-3-methyladenine glycosylase I [Parcubacteria group bacterium Greene0416_14]|nr:MAG: DNA-3-methyladenine glycosylase I [Parcubacteria group bacterium Greene0416_14]TSD07046.1 MAG: DNA-3-methyladenine glycosylase I [Parcubacteria group bacterium Greene0714_4]